MCPSLCLSLLSYLPHSYLRLPASHMLRGEKYLAVTVGQVQALSVRDEEVPKALAGQRIRLGVVNWTIMLIKAGD